MPQIRQALAVVCAALTLLLALGGLATSGTASGAVVTATVAHEAVAVVATQHATRAGTGLPEHPPGATSASGAAVSQASEAPALPIQRASGSASADAPVGRASRDRSPPVQP